MQSCICRQIRWQLDRIVAAAAEPRERRRLINWLLRCEASDDRALADGDLAKRAIAWWSERYTDAERQKEQQENPLLPWRNSLANRRWQLERALLQFAIDPGAAVDRLCELAGDQLRAEIEQRLGEFVAAEHRRRNRDGDGDGQYIYLNWSFAAQPPTTRHRLRELGFAAGLFTGGPVIPRACCSAKRSRSTRCSPRRRCASSHATGRAPTASRSAVRVPA